LFTFTDNEINPANGAPTQASDTMALTYTTRDQIDVESPYHLLVGRNVSFNPNYDANQKTTPVPFEEPRPLCAFPPGKLIGHVGFFTRNRIT